MYIPFTREQVDEQELFIPSQDRTKDENTAEPKAFPRLLINIQHNTTSNLPILHIIIDLWQLRQTQFLKVSPDLSSRRDIQCLLSILSVAHVRTYHPNRPENGKEHISFNIRVTRQTDSNEHTARTNIIQRLLVRQTARSGDNSSLRTESIRSGRFDIVDKILGGFEIDEFFSTELFAELFLVCACVDGNDAVASGYGVLDGKMTESTACTGDSDKLTGDELSFFECLVNRETGTKDGCGLVEGQSIRNDGEMVGVRHGVLLERTVDVETRAQGVRAVRLGASPAEGAVQARCGDPLDADTITYLDVLVSSVTEGNNDTGTFMPTNQGELVVEGPITKHGVKIGVTDTSVDDTNESFAALELALDGDIFDGNGSTLLVEDGDSVLALHLELLLTRVLGGLGTGRSSSGSHFVFVVVLLARRSRWSSRLS